MNKYNQLLYRSPVSNIGPVRDKNRRPKRYVLLLLATKLLLTIAIFLCYDLFKSINAIIYIFTAKFISAIIFILVHKPISSGKRLVNSDYKNVSLYSLFSIALTLLWMEGFMICGPVRTILLSQHSEIVFIVLLNLVFNTEEHILPSSSRGSVFYGAGLLCLFLFDQDKHGEHQTEDSITSHIYHHFGEVFTWLGLPDHKGGILLLLLVSLCQVFLNNYGKKLSHDIDGNKRLKALSSSFEVLFLSPIVLLVSIYSTEALSLWSNLPELIFISIVMYVINFYVDAISVTHLHKYLTHRWSSITIFTLAIIVGFIWEHKNNVHHKHAISMGVIFAAFFFIAASRLLVQPPPINPPHGKLIGYATDGKPIYTYATKDGFVPKSLFKKLQQYIRIILESSDSRNIFFYLCINLVFTGVELLYGMWTNSLGLISDGFHMLFDCSALVLGLWASIASKWSATKTFSFGYGRIEVLSGFVNGLFLVVIAFAVFTTAIQRIVDPPVINTEKLLAVSIAGLVVNILGITVFSHAHSHGGGTGSCDHGKSSHGHSHDHGHSHSRTHSENHGHSHSGGHSHEKKKGSANMQGVFLHVLADTLGSVGVILSSLLIEYFGWLIADPLCSLFIAILIFLSVLPLLKQSSNVLLQRTPKELENEIVEKLYSLKNIEGVLSYRECHVWQHTSNENIASIVVQVQNDVSEHKIRQKVTSLFKNLGISRLTIQVEKETFHDHMMKLTTGYYSAVNFPELSYFHNISKNDTSIRIKYI